MTDAQFSAAFTPERWVGALVTCFTSRCDRLTHLHPFIESLATHKTYFVPLSVPLSSP